MMNFVFQASLCVLCDQPFMAFCQPEGILPNVCLACLEVRSLSREQQDQILNWLEAA